jgi:hypothetical protein
VAQGVGSNPSTTLLKYIREEKGDITADTAEIKGTLEVNMNNFMLTNANLYKLLDTYILPRLNDER